MYKKLPKNEVYSYKSITVDVFDTILMRKIWPEDLQFLEVAKSWVPIINKYLEIDATYYELFTYRRDSRRILKFSKAIQNKKPSYTDDLLTDFIDREEIDIDEWFSSLIDILCDAYDLKLGEVKKSKLLADLIKVELDIEKQNLHVNKKVINFLEKAKSDNPKLKIIFISDMYLSSVYIYQLLKHFGIDNLFNEGFSSSDMKKAKWSGKIYQHLNTAHIKPGSNLHIGDNYHSDVKMAKLFGSDAVYYNPLRNKLYRRLVTRAGRIRLAKISHTQRDKIRKKFIANFQNNDLGNKHTVSRQAQKVGYLFGPPLATYLSEMSWLASTSNIPMIAISSEALTFQKYISKLSPRLYSSSKFSYMPSLNRRKVLLALVDKILKSDISKYSKPSLANILRFGEGLGQNRNIYQFIAGSESLGGPEIVIDNLNNLQLGKVISKSIVGSNTKDIQEARIEFNKFVRHLKGSDAVILDVGWNGTTQAMLQQILLAENISGDIHGLYIGNRSNSHVKHLQRGTTKGWLYASVDKNPDHKIFVPEIWEYVYTNKNYGTGLQALVQQGLESSINQYSKSKLHASPMEIFYATKPLLTNLLDNPHKDIVELFGLIKFDSGFVDTKYISLVNMNKSKKRVIIELFLRPKSSIKSMTAQYCWTAGYINYYSIRIIAKPVLKIVGLIKHRDLI